ncbi:DsbA family protein [Curtobacterium poinsettiae]|uniref:Thioredoxin domain-containing protein n=1 Tax=Curtobacterium poinsettiae TaxID=159612 RepID=A0ABT3S2L4_9MICO|nr:thioredoxin domain-containing protein [Curtobacterium flaccumfaciens]MBT1610540.1 thioredoxin domain-containing protein [Curtobacterium flaccumfaciens pv. poinsettiae]MCX2849070.1 thioredoxin domain-containing protein [Curtobacterium flaccumfaciens pv. poinsettiae]UXN19982.1 DsbA family protein [Curtobacterium flaccumfaciens pv. poinsettiae]
MSEQETSRARRDAVRERARATRAKEQSRRRRLRTLGLSGAVIGGLAVVAVVVVLVAGSVQPAGPGPRNAASDGVLLTGVHGRIVPVETRAVPAGGTPTPTDQDGSKTAIVVYADYMCPYCNQFETAQMPQIRQWVEDGTATLELHPLGLLDRLSLGSRYSTRSAAAAACVADHDPDAFLAYNASLSGHQPSENTRGLTNDELASLARGAGARAPEVASCITGQRFAGWVADATNRAVQDPVPNSTLDGITSTPTILVDGEQYDPDGSTSLADPEAFASFVRRHDRAS